MPEFVFILLDEFFGAAVAVIVMGVAVKAALAVVSAT